MSEPSRAVRRIAVIGGGITGLAAAHRLLELDPTLELSILESSPRLGGVLQTVRQDGFLIELSADNFLTNTPWAVDLCQRIGLGDQLLPTDPAHRHALVVRRGRLHKVPSGFSLLAPGRMWPMLTTPLLSPLGKLRLACEFFVPRRAGDVEESLATFARRRLGRETFERLVQPLVGGIYTADPERLSLRAVLPRFLEMERRYGSLIRAARHEAAAGPNGSPRESGARYGMFVAPRDGMSSLIDALTARLPRNSIMLNTPVERLARNPGGRWSVTRHGHDNPLEFDAVIVATGSSAAGRLLTTVDRELSDALLQIPHASTVMVAVGYRRDQITHPLDAFGFVVPTIEKRRILAASFASVKFPGRAPAGSVLIRAFVGGATQPELAELPDEALRRLVIEDLGELLGIQGEPSLVHIAHWPQAMPQYHLGHVELVENIIARVKSTSGLALAGNAYHGVGLPHCIRAGQQAAEKNLSDIRPN